MSIEARSFKQGGMDQDSTIDEIAANDVLSRYNMRVTGTTESEEGDGSNIEGTNIISSAMGGGLNKCIGAAGFPTIRKGYAIIYSSQGFWQLKEFDYDSLTETVLFTNKTNSGGISIIDFDPQYYVCDIKLIQDRYLAFTDNNSNPHLVDLVRLKNGSLGTITAEDFSLTKGQPIKEPKAVYNNDAGRSVNLLKNRLFQFREQYQKLSNELTAWGTISKRLVPVDEPTPSKGTDVTIANNIIVSVDAGNNRTERIKVAARYDLLDWFYIKDIDRATVIALPNIMVNVSQEIYEAYDPATNTYSFAFYNDGIYQNVDVLETDLPYDYVPNLAETLEVINGSILVLGGITEGYDRPTANVALTVSSYDPQINIINTVGDPLKGSGFDNGEITGFGPDQHKRFVQVTITGTAKTGDKIFVSVRDLRDYNAKQIYAITVLSSENNNTQSVINRLSTMIPNSSVSGATIRFKTTPYYEFDYISFDLVNAGTGASKSIHALKSNSSYQAALANYDKDGKYFPIVTDERFVVKTPSYAQTHGLTSQINWDLKDSVPPVGSLSYQWLLTLNNTHATDLFINGAYNDSRSDADYLVFDINSLYKFNQKNSSSILNYDYSEGDRVTLMFTFSGTNTPIKWFDSPAIDVEVVGLDIVVDTAVTPNVTHHYLKVRKSSALNVADINSVGTLMEIYSPKKRVTTTDGVSTENPQLFFEIGERFDVVNGQYSVKQGIIRDGDVYFKTRTLPGVLDPNTPYTFVVEDFNFSDFYKSDYYSIGRPRIYDDEQGKLKKSASIRYSDTFKTGSKVNGITRFYGERIYGDGDGETSSNYGSIKKLRVRDNYLICIQELKVGHIPINMSIVEDQVEQRQYAISDKLLNFVRYLSGNFGIGTAKESYGESQNGTIYFADPNNSLPIRDGYDGLKPIAGKMLKYFRRVLKQAKKYGLKIIGYYDNFNDEFNLSIENRNGVLTNFVFNTTDWQLLDNYVVNPADLVITSNSNGTAVLNGDGTATFTPTAGYTGNAGFTFTFLNAGSTITKNSCGIVIPGTTTINPFYFTDLTNQPLSTVVMSNSILVSGNNIGVPISITGGQYQINGGAWVSSAGTVYAGDVVVVRLTTSATNETTVSAVLTIGAYSDSFDVKTKSSVPVTVNWSLSRNAAPKPYVDGNLVLQKNSGAGELFTFIGSGTSTLGFTVGDLLTVNTFHYHLGFRWPDDASLTVKIKNAVGTVIYTYTGGLVNVADVDAHSITLVDTTYTVEVTTFSNDTTLKAPPLGYTLSNASSVADNVIQISAIDQTTGLFMLNIPMPDTAGGTRSGAYNMKNDANPQTLRINNTGTVSIHITTTTSGGFMDVHDVPGGNYLDLSADKSGFTMVINY